MKFGLSLIILLLWGFASFAQSDLLVLKKRNRTVQSFFPGKEMMFSTASGFHIATVTAVERDSVFLIQYDIRRIITNLGVYRLDTVASYKYGINYRDITAFGIESRKFNWSGSGAALFGGGILLTASGLVTWALAKKNTRYYARPALVISGVALSGVGYLIMKSGGREMRLGKKYSLHYISLK